MQLLFDISLAANADNSNIMYYFVPWLHRAAIAIVIQDHITAVFHSLYNDTWVMSVSSLIIARGIQH